jgi:hypothetical protein
MVDWLRRVSRCVGPRQVRRVDMRRVDMRRVAHDPCAKLPPAAALSRGDR